MNYKLYMIISIVTLFTACGEVNSGNENSLPTENIDDPISCQEIQKQNKLFDYNYEILPKIEPINNIKILTQKSKTFNKTIEFDKKGLYELFTTEYYWASLVSKDLNYTKYLEPQKLIDAVKYKKDKWSFAITIKEYNNAISQQFKGVGLACQDFESGCLITYVQIDSPAEKIDLRRGDLITKIDGKVATENLFYEKAQKDNKINLELVRKNSNQKCKGSITPRKYSYKVVKEKILKTAKSEKIAYLRLDSFLGDTQIQKQIDSAFDIFKKDNLKKLIIDLRYNGGGSVDIASELLNKLSTSHTGEHQFTLEWNSDYRSRDELYKFKAKSNSLDLKQLILLTTQNTASASELIISAMKPYLSKENLVVIGDRTYGKPVGMGGRSDRSYYYFLINFIVKNSLGFYEYFDGIPVSEGCKVEDDPFHEMGDPKESMLKTALHYIEEGSCK